MLLVGRFGDGELQGLVGKMFIEISAVITLCHGNDIWSLLISYDSYELSPLVCNTIMMRIYALIEGGLTVGNES